MSDKSSIEWTDATWSPVTGCTKVSAGCDHCYIERTPPFRMAGRRFDKPGVGATTGVILHHDRLYLPLRWRKPRRVFVNSLADLFHDEVSTAFIASVFAIMALTPRHTYQVLTKRHARMRALLAGDELRGPVWQQAHALVVDGIGGDAEEPPWPLPNVWLGVSVEDQKWADIRIPALLDTPAAVRWLSCEPLLGEVDLFNHLFPTPCPRGCGCRWPEDADWRDCGCNGPCCTDEWKPNPGIDWVVVGGESGPGARPMDPEWARGLVDTCIDAGVPAFVKQLGSRWGKQHHDIDLFPEALRVREYPAGVR